MFLLRLKYLVGGYCMASYLVVGSLQIVILTTQVAVQLAMRDVKI